jgi:hypothetical protein
MVGDNIGWCFQGLLYISIYGRCGCAKCKNKDDVGWRFQGPVPISIYGRYDCAK